MQVIGCDLENRLMPLFFIPAFCDRAPLCSAKTSSFWVFACFSRRHFFQSIFVMQPAQDRTPLPRGDHTEFGDLKFPAPECLLMVQVCLALGQNAGGPCCNDLTYQRFSFPAGQRGVSENTISVRGDHVWLGGAGGVQLFTHGQFYLMRWKDPDLPGRVSGIVETLTGDLWVNGFSGIAHVSASELKNWLRDPGSTVSGEAFNELDGLPGLSGEVLPEPSLVEAPGGRLWFATTKGIVC